MLESIATFAGGSGPEVAIALEGMAGAGKTSLAVRAAALLRSRGGLTGPHLYVDLRGAAPHGQQPVDPELVLEKLLRELGWQGQLPRVPLRASTYQKLASHRNAVILLDNAADEEQVRPLLPADRGSLVIIAGRSRFTGLGDLVQRVEVGVLSDQESVRLLSRVAGLNARAEDSEELRVIASKCGHLPLALAAIAGHIRDHPTWTLADHSHALQDLVLEAGVSRALALSYDGLPDDEQRVLRLLALCPGRDTTADTTAVLADVDKAEAATSLVLLERAHLMQSSAPDRFRLHEMVRAHVNARARVDEPPHRRQSAIARWLDHYTATASAAMESFLLPRESGDRQNSPARETSALTSFDAAACWLENEAPNIVDAIEYATDHDFPYFTTSMANTVWRYLATTGLHDDWLFVHSTELRAAQRDADRRSEGVAHVNLAMVQLEFGRSEVALGHAIAARDVGRQLGDDLMCATAWARAGASLLHLGRVTEARNELEHAAATAHRIGAVEVEAVVNNSLGMLHHQIGNLPQAFVHYRKAHEQSMAAGNSVNAGKVAANIGLLHLKSGQLLEALRYFRKALEVASDVKNMSGIAAAQINLGLVLQRLGRHAAATHYNGLALEATRRLGDKDGEARVLGNMGTLARVAGKLDDAKVYHDTALDIATALDDPDLRSEALNDRAESLLTMGNYEGAYNDNTAALDLAHLTGSSYEQARALVGLGHLSLVGGRPDQAVDHWRRAVKLYKHMGVPEAELVRAHLDALGGAGG